MAQVAEDTNAEAIKDEAKNGREPAGTGNEQDLPRVTTNEEFDSCDGLIKKEGEMFAKWWAARSTLPNRHTARSGWTPDDLIILIFIRDAYETSTRMESWGCLCNESTYWKNHNQQTEWSKTGMDDSKVVQTRSEKWNCEREMVDQPGMGQTCHMAGTDHDTACEGETLEMVSDHVAGNRGNPKGTMVYRANGNNDTEGAPGLREDQYLQTSVWIVKAVACIMMKINYSMSEGDAQRTDTINQTNSGAKERSTGKDPVEENQVTPR